jgi:hypothetical protein
VIVRYFPGRVVTIEHVGGAIGLGAGSSTITADPHPRLDGGGGGASPSSASVLQSRLEGGSGDATWYGDDADANKFTLLYFYFSTYILIKPFM